MESARCKAFIESVERGSFRAAAEALGYTPSAVSQLVAALEKDLGLTLLVRSKKGVKVTSEGAKLAPIVRSYLAREKEMYELASEMQGISVGNLTIAAYPSVATTWLPEIVRTFQRDYPEVQFNIMEGIRSEIFGHLDDHVADMGFLAYAEPMDYEWTPLAEEAVIAVVPEDGAWDKLRQRALGPILERSPCEAAARSSAEGRIRHSLYLEGAHDCSGKEVLRLRDPLH